MVTTTTDLKLSIELVPSTSWYRNMRAVMPRPAWNALCKQVYARHDYRCAICGATGALACHEMWEYDDYEHVQRLTGFTALCSLCHHVKHIGLAGTLAAQGELDFEEVVQHFMRVNACDRATFKAHYDAAFALWEARSQHQWEVYLGEYDRFL